MKRAELVSLLKSVIKINGHTLGVAVGNGMVADYTMKGGADFILAMKAGRFRQMGQHKKRRFSVGRFVFSAGSDFFRILRKLKFSIFFF